MGAEIEPGGYRTSDTHTPGVIIRNFSARGRPANASMKATTAADAAKID